eukprot:2232493-Prymnesium_polylepis.1
MASLLRATCGLTIAEFCILLRRETANCRQKFPAMARSHMTLSVRRVRFLLLLPNHLLLGTPRGGSWVARPSSQCR